MSAVLGETDYQTTGFDNLNFVTDVKGDLSYCAGCNGSFELSFRTSSVTEPDGLGVFGVGIEVSVNEGPPAYYARVFYGDGSSSNHLLPASGFWGVTAPEFIERIHIGLFDGEATTEGFFAIGSLTLGSDRCGNGARTVHEECDDGNLTNGDTCSSTCEITDPDFDLDGVADLVDNCPEDRNPDQEDRDGDGLGDVCDPSNGLDVDGDGLENGSDNCPFQDNPMQEDSDADGFGDACDTTDGTDVDNDGVPNGEDNCPFTGNSSQADVDEDGFGDACDDVTSGGCSHAPAPALPAGIALVALLFVRRR
ncbi:MAG: thrombospondin type 3 repeat-containing protein [Myxococcales bacterium]|nr:thrombospondin type 3 repeat-containing protein [Myxococcales bacterium]